MSEKVKSLHGIQSVKQVGAELLGEEGLAGVVAVGLNADGEYHIRSFGMKNSDLAYALIIIQKAILERMT
jgi:hypothetical protein